jgi:hypothetical protein
MTDAEHSILSDGDYIASLNRDLMIERARAERAEADIEGLANRLESDCPSGYDADYEYVCGWKAAVEQLRVYVERR